MSLTCKTISANGNIALSDEPMGRGGEGSVYKVTKHNVTGLDSADSLVAKIYHNPQEGDRESKVNAMINAVPESDSVAWPLGIVYDNNRFVGYVMTKLDIDEYQSWAILSNSGDRKKRASDFDVRYAITSTVNLAIAIQSIHDAGHCVGDINESNILVAADARVMIVDTDSAQITSPSGKVYPCLVGKPEYTAAELTHGKLKDNPRTKESDVFAYCVAAYQMLTGGSHPADARFTGNDDPPSIVERIRAGWFPGITKTPSNVQKPPQGLVDAIPLVFKNIFKSGLSTNPGERPPLNKIFAAEKKVVDNLVQCKKVSTHWYDSREGKCSWCENAKKGLGDPWNVNPPKPKPKKVNQTSLPAVSFKSNDTSPVARRAPVGGSAPRGSVTPPTPTRAAPAYNNIGPTGSSRPVQRNTPITPSRMPPAIPPSPGANNSVQPQYGLAREPVVVTKHKGKTVVSYADGTQGVRSPLMQIMKVAPGKALEFFAGEHPMMTFWWSKYRPVAHPIGLVVGILLSLTIAVGILQLPSIFIDGKHYNHYVVTISSIYVLFSAAAAAFFGLILFLTAGFDLLRSRIKYKKFYRSDSFIKTALQFVIVSIFWGPLLPIVVILSVVEMWAGDPSKKTSARSMWK